MFWRNIHLVRVNFSFYHTAVEIMEISWKRRFYYRVDFTKYYGGRISCFSTRWKLRKHRNHSVVISMKFRNFSYQPLWKKSPWNRLFQFSLFGMDFTISRNIFKCVFSIQFWQEFRQSNGFTKEVIKEFISRENLCNSLTDFREIVPNVQTGRPYTHNT